MEVNFKDCLFIYVTLHPRDCLFIPLSQMPHKCKRELRNTRIELETPLRKSAYDQKCFSYEGATMWNHLCSHTKLSPTLTVFKKSIAS